jgi:hypothetical protein
MAGWTAFRRVVICQRSRYVNTRDVTHNSTISLDIEGELVLNERGHQGGFNDRPKIQETFFWKTSK